MNQSTAIQQRAKQLGIADAYWDVDGNHHTITDETLEYFIEALTSTTPTESEYADIVVLMSDTAQTLPLINPNHCTLIDEENQSLALALPITDTKHLQLPALSAGYYTLVINNQTITRIRLIVAPPTCYQPEGLSEQQQHGLSLQLYSLRSANDDCLRANWGIGDFADLNDAVTIAAERGLDFVGINPLHAMFPESPEWASPYSPSSRLWLNWIYLSIGGIPEFIENPDNLAWFATHQTEIEQLRNADKVDYSAVSALKRQALALAFNAFDKYSSQERRKDFVNFIARGGESLALNSAFYVISDLKADGVWGSMGYDVTNINSPDLQQLIDDYDDSIVFYNYLQWLIDEQLSVIQQHALDCGLMLGVYGDLAVGVAENSADAWVNPELYALPASIGAPPDPLGPVGQNWGLPPLHPNVLKQQGFQPFIDLLRANMKYCGALRIDHVMGLYRLWLIPDGKDASLGAYIHYPFDALMAILAIESQRAECLIIGEDLGTVPNEVRETLDRYQVLSYDVLYFAGRYGDNEQTRWRKPSNVNRKALGVIGTHDLPPLTGWWHCRDLDLLGKLRILDEHELTPMYDARLNDKQALLNALKTDGYLPENYHIDAMKMAMHEQLNRAIHAYARDAKTQLFATQPENFCGVDWAFNVPGTTTEMPNWRTKLPYPLNHIKFVLD